MECGTKPDENISNFSSKCDYLCRICLSKDVTDLVTLFDNDEVKNVSQKILFCTNIKLYPLEGLPNDICQMCLNNLAIAYEFRIKCKESDIFLRKTYSECFVDDDKYDVREFTNKTEEKNCKETSINDNLNENIVFTNCLKDSNSQISVKKRKFAKEFNEINENEVGNLEIKEEKSDLFDEDIFVDDYSYNECKPDDEYQHKKMRKKSKKKSKIINKSLEDETNFDNVIVKDELDGCVNDGNIPFDEMNQATVDEIGGDVKTKMYICSECGKPLSKKSSLKRHIETMHSVHSKRQSATITRKTGHGKDKRFHCPSCPYVTKFSQSLVYHERIHTGERPHKCPHCSRSFSQPGSLTCHLKTHSDKTYFTCAACGRQFKHKDSYEVHKLIHSENRELFTCQLCNATLKSRKTLESHMNRHNNIKNYSCETCGLRFVTLVELINHSKKHNTEKIYKCNFCDFRTALKRSLQSHVKRHSNYRPFKCQSCDLACFTKWELKNHEKTHTRESNYTCFICQRKFIHSSSVNKHMQRSHGVKYQRNEEVDRRKVK